MGIDKIHKYSKCRNIQNTEIFKIPSLLPYTQTNDRRVAGDFYRYTETGPLRYSRRGEIGVSRDYFNERLREALLLNFPRDGLTRRLAYISVFSEIAFT